MKIHNVSNPGRNVIWVDIKVDGKPMELDRGSAVSIITHELIHEEN